MKKGDLIKLRQMLTTFCRHEQELITQYPDVFCDRDFDRTRSLLQFMKAI